MVPHRLRAPAADGGLLIEPSPGQLVAPTEVALPIDGASYNFQGRRAGRLREMAREQVRARALEHHLRSGLDLPAEPAPQAPWFVTGHQPELFHPGVWIKNFAVARLAGDRGGVGLNLLVDNDIPRRASIRVPHQVAGVLRSIPVEYDDWAGEVPYEDLTVQNEMRFATFGDRVLETLGGRVADPLIEEFWPRVLRARSRTALLGLRLAIARREQEAAWGAGNWEVPLSAVCETEAFLWFASHLLAHLPRFQTVHNEALTRYRATYGIRSRHHPVAALGREGEWLEAPFWAWRASSPRRRPLLARQLARTVQIRITGETEPLLEFPLGPDRDACCAVERLRELPALGVRLRTRALTTTMFARLLLGDLFIHGIGGAKYDELGDEIVRNFFGFEPPGYLALSMTLWLSPESAPATPETLRTVNRALRDLQFHPERHLSDPTAPEVREWVEAKRRALAAPVATRPQRAARFREIRRLNAALQDAVRADRDRLTAQRAALIAGLKQNAVAHHREFALVLHSQRRLRETLSRALPEIEKAVPHNMA